MLKCFTHAIVTYSKVVSLEVYQQIIFTSSNILFTNSRTSVRCVVDVNSLDQENRSHWGCLTSGNYSYGEVQVTMLDSTFIIEENIDLTSQAFGSENSKAGPKEHDIEVANSLRKHLSRQ